MQGFRIFQEISLTAKPCRKSVESQGWLCNTCCWEEGRRLQHSILALEAELHHRSDSTRVCVCNVYIWGSIVQHIEFFGNTEKQGNVNIFIVAETVWEDTMERNPVKPEETLCSSLPAGLTRLTPLTTWETLNLHCCLVLGLKTRHSINISHRKRHSICFCK